MQRHSQNFILGGSEPLLCMWMCVYVHVYMCIQTPRISGGVWTPQTPPLATPVCQCDKLMTGNGWKAHLFVGQYLVYQTEKLFLMCQFLFQHTKQRFLIPVVKSMRGILSTGSSGGDLCLKLPARSRQYTSCRATWGCHTGFVRRFIPLPVLCALPVQTLGWPLI